jgi:hydrogenase maturation protein HypF
MLLEAVANPLEGDCYQIPLIRGRSTELDWRPLVQQLLVDRTRETAPGDMAMKFHRALAAGIGAMSDMFPHLPVVLTGGCFQNRLLTELVAERLAGGKALALPGVIPCGDGGLAAGQLAVAVARTAGGINSCV